MSFHRAARDWSPRPILSAFPAVLTLPFLLLSLVAARHDLLLGLAACGIVWMAAALAGHRIGAVSDRRKAGRARELREAAACYQAILDTAADAIVIADARGMVRSFNCAAETIFGYAAAEVIGRNIGLLMDDDDRSAHDGHMRRYAQTGQKRIIGRAREVHGRRKDGSIVLLDLSMAEWHDGAGQRCFTGIMRDVTERKQRADELRAAKEAAELARLQAENASRAKSDFLAVMSHEIRNPLNSIKGFAELLADSRTLTPQQRRHVELIGTANAALLTVVNDILDLSKIEAGQTVLHPQPFSLTALVDDAASLIRAMAAQKSIAFAVAADRGLPEWLMGDDARLRQVLLNLLYNAVKFTAGGEVLLTVHHEGSSARGERLRFRISDTGIGIPADRIATLFQRFSQGDASISRQYGGTGLGLAISKQLIDLMGGCIEVASEPGKGSTFAVRLTLPRSEPATAPRLALSQSGQKARAARLLVVDDVEMNRELAVEVLRQRGYLVDAVAGGAEAIEAVRGGLYDLVLMDIQMPGIDGIAATKAIRALPGPVGAMPILAMTANVLPQQVRGFHEAGMTAHVGKPIIRGELFAAIERALCGERTGEQPTFATASVGRHAYEELVHSVGSRKADQLAVQFGASLRRRFVAAEQARFDAHEVIPIAGVLGFLDLMDQCRALEAVPLDDPAAFRQALDHCRAARDLTIGDIATRWPEADIVPLRTGTG